MVLSERHLAAPSIHSLNSFVLTVPGLNEAQRFYESFGLRVATRPRRLDLFTHEHDHRWATLHQNAGHPKHLEYVSFGCYEQDFDALAVYLRARNFATCPPHPLAPSGGLWLAHPDGIPIEIVP